MKNGKKRTGNYMILFMAVTITATQIIGVQWTDAAEELVYTGTTQLNTDEQYFSADTSAVKLTVEEVYVEEGSQLAEGDNILKVTEDSYREALAYYEAALIKADSSLTDTKLEYDQGILEAKYTLESAQADAENAEYIRTYQTNEVENALTDHEKILEDMDERIAELEEGIADGSYDISGSSITSGGVSDGDITGTGNKKSDSGEEKQSEKENDTPQPETGRENTENNTSQPETGRENTENDTSQPETGRENTENNTSQPETDEKTLEELQQELTEKMKKAEELAQSLTQELKQIQDETEEEAVEDTDYTVYTEQLKNIITQLEADVEGQEQVKMVLSAYDFTEKDSTTEVLKESMEGDQRVLDSLKEIQEKMTKYQTLLSSIITLLGDRKDTALVDTEMLTQMSEYLSVQADISELSMTLLQQYESKIKEQEEKSSESESESNSEIESEKTKESENNPSDSFTENTGMSDAASSGSGSMQINNEGSGIQQSNQESSQGKGMEEQKSLSGEEISLLGDAYDLTEAEQLLARVPSDSEDAQDLIDEMEDCQKSTEAQYEELQRKKKIFGLEIQHTYDMAVIAGKMAELTYQQDMEEWKEILAEAEQKKTDLETQKELLESMADGVICADQAGTAASVFYEAGDVLNNDTPLISFYDTGTVCITLEVDQEEIANLSVGDIAEVTLAGAGYMEGTVSEKSTEPEEGTSRSTVNYLVTIDIDNADGRLSEGLSATVTFGREETSTNE